MTAHLAHLNPRSVLERGYSIVETADGKIARASDDVGIGDELKVNFARGWAHTRVTGKG